MEDIFAIRTKHLTLFTLVLPAFKNMESYLTDEVIHVIDQHKQYYHMIRDNEMERYCNRLITTISYIPLDMAKKIGFKLHTGMRDDGSWVFNFQCTHVPIDGGFYRFDKQFHMEKEKAK